MRSMLKGILTAATLTGLTAAPAMADEVFVPISDNGIWNTFYFQGFGSQFQDLSGDPLDFTFTLDHPDILTVTDGYFAGDQFDVAIAKAPVSITLAPTSTPGDPNDYVGDDWTAAVRDPNFSSMVFYLGAGSYQVSGSDFLSPFGAGEGALRLGAIPEPATWASMLLGFGAIGATMRRSRRKRTAALA